MTEGEWLACGDPHRMLDHLRGRATARKVRLYACAWAYRSWHLIQDGRSQEAVVTAERFADGLATESTLTVAHAAALDAWRAIHVEYGGNRFRGGGSGPAKRAAELACQASAADGELWPRLRRYRRLKPADEFTLATTLRDVFANPFRPVVADPGWRTADVLAVAGAIYDEARYEDFPVLADALMDSGCSDEALLGHLRSGDPHVRGCWVLDLILGKE